MLEIVGDGNDCCGFEHFNKSIQICCDSNKLVPGDACCGSSSYFRGIQGCCNGVVTSISNDCCQKFDNSSQVCCNGRFFFLANTVTFFRFLIHSGILLDTAKVCFYPEVVSG